MASTAWAACWVLASSAQWSCNPAVLLSCWATGAYPVNLLIASLCGVIGEVALSRIALVVPLCQERMLAVCKRWAFGVTSAPGPWYTPWAASLSADSIVDACSPSVATVRAESTSCSVGTRYHSVWSANISIVVPLSCNSRCFSCQ